jgi:adenylate cyclase
MLGGWAMAAQGRDEEGLEEHRRGLDAYAATGAALARPFFLSLLADVHQRGGRLNAAAATLREALAFGTATGERWLDAELNRLQGELALAASPPDLADAERHFREAIDVAERQKQTSLALRGALGLARLQRADGRVEEARHLVGELYGRFAEGFATRDLQDASAFLTLPR